MARYRWPTVIVAASALVLAAFSLGWIFIAYADYRSPDFTTASAGPIEGTCVEAVSIDQLSASRYDKTDWSCGTTSKDHLSNLLAVSVHAMYAAHATAAYTGDAKAVYDAVVSATQGVDPAYSITREHAYAVLSVLGTPSSTDCAAIYNVSAEGAAPTPIAPVVVCDADVPASNPSPTVTADTSLLFTHCAHQFSYARSYPTAGTFGIPKVGIKASPALLPIVATNATTTWQDRARIVVGTRWGYSTIFYTVAMLATAFFIMDSTVLLLAELTRVDSYYAQNAIVAGDRAAMREGMMTMLATFQSKRNFRWTIALLLIILETLLWVLLIGVPWGFGTEFKRPICEIGDAEHWIAPFYATTKAGWKLDWDAFSLEMLVLLSHILILIAVPISQRARRGGGEQGRRPRTIQGDTNGFTGVAVDSLRSAYWFALLSVGGLLFYIGQSVALFRFGVAWAEGVSMDRHNEISLGTMLYDHVNAVLYLSLTIGLTLGSIIGRWLLAGLSCTSFTIFLVWVLLTVAAFIPPFFVSTYWVFFAFEDSKGQDDCKSIFGDLDEFVFARTACDLRAGTYIAAIILLLLAALGPIVIGLWDYSRVVCLPRRRAWVDMPDYWRQLIEPANPKFRTMSMANGDAQTDFFRFKTRLTQPAESVA